MFCFHPRWSLNVPLHHQNLPSQKSWLENSTISRREIVAKCSNFRLGSSKSISHLETLQGLSCEILSFGTLSFPFTETLGNQRFSSAKKNVIRHPGVATITSWGEHLKIGISPKNPGMSLKERITPRILGLEPWILLGMDLDSYGKVSQIFVFDFLGQNTFWKKSNQWSKNGGWTWLETSPTKMVFFLLHVRTRMSANSNWKSSSTSNCGEKHV